ncbi:hypothetical protein GJ496_007335 [Pomphorhynchus laevis]|nr:hypothetical protein GJ496_007335 [Pomphorhynchus laevis]
MSRLWRSLHRHRRDSNVSDSNRDEIDQFVCRYSNLQNSLTRSQSLEVSLTDSCFKSNLELSECAKEFIKVFGALSTSEWDTRFKNIRYFCRDIASGFNGECRILLEALAALNTGSSLRPHRSLIDILHISNPDRIKNTTPILIYIDAMTIISVNNNDLILLFASSYVPSFATRLLVAFDTLTRSKQNLNKEIRQDFHIIEGLISKVSKLLENLMRSKCTSDELVMHDNLQLMFSTCCLLNTDNDNDDNVSCIPLDASGSDDDCSTVVINIPLFLMQSLLVMMHSGPNIQTIEYIIEKSFIEDLIDKIKSITNPRSFAKIRLLHFLIDFVYSSTKISHIVDTEFINKCGYQLVAHSIQSLFNTDCSNVLKETTNDSEPLASALLDRIFAMTLTCFYDKKLPYFRSKYPFICNGGYKQPEPKGKGITISNMHAFGVLQTVFVKCTNHHCNELILTYLTKLMTNDPVNYFVIASSKSLCEFLKVLPEKEKDIQEGFFYLLLYIITSTDYILFNEMTCLNELMQTDTNSPCFTLRCINFLRQLIRLNDRSAEALRELRFVNVMIRNLRRFLLLNHNQSDSDNLLDEKELGFLTIEFTMMLLTDNTSTIDEFRDFGGIIICQSLVTFDLTRQSALSLLMQIISTSNSEEDFNCLLEIASNAPANQLSLRQSVLNAVTFLLNLSPNLQTTFRRCGGFLQILSLLDSYKHLLCFYKHHGFDTSTINTVDLDELVIFIRTVLSTFIAGFRNHPTNIIFVNTEIQWKQINQYINNLVRCDMTSIGSNDSSAANDDFVELKLDNHLLNNVALLFRISKPAFQSLHPNITIRCVLIKLLLDATVDSQNRPLIKTLKDSNISFGGNSAKTLNKSNSLNAFDLCSLSTRSSLSTLSVRGKSDSAETHIVNQDKMRFSSGADIKFPAAFLCVFEQLAYLLLEKAEHSIHDELVNFISGPIFELLSSRKSVQILCKHQMSHQLLESFGDIIKLPVESVQSCQLQIAYQTRFRLQLCILSILERLAKFSISPGDIRMLLKMGMGENSEQLSYLLLNPNSHTFCPNLSRAIFKTIMTMITAITSGSTLHDVLTTSYASSNQAYILARLSFCSYIKLQGSSSLGRSKDKTSSLSNNEDEVFGYIIANEFIQINETSSKGSNHLPNTAGRNAIPISSNVSTASKHMGFADRLLSNQTGLSYTCWFRLPLDQPCIINLLTIVHQKDFRDEACQCILNVILIISSNKVSVCANNALYTGAVSNRSARDRSFTKFDLTEYFKFDEWTFFGISLNRGLLKTSSISIVINDNVIPSKKLHYISSLANSLQMLSASSSPVDYDLYNRDGSVSAIIGNCPKLHQYISLDKKSVYVRKSGQLDMIWYLAECSLYNEAISTSQLRNLYRRSLSSLTSPFQIKESTSTSSSTPSLSSSSANEDNPIFTFNAKYYDYINIDDVITPVGSISNSFLYYNTNGPAVRLRNVVRRIIRTKSSFSQRDCNSSVNYSLSAIIQSSCDFPVVNINNLTSSINVVGGCKLLLSLINQASDTNSLYASLKAFLCAIRSNAYIDECVALCDGFQMLKIILLQKRELLTIHIFHLISTLCNCQSSSDSAVINSKAFTELFANLSLWKFSGSNVQCSIFEQLVSVLSTPSSLSQQYMTLLRDTDMISRIFFFLRTSKVTLELSLLSSIGSFLFVYLVHSDSSTEYIKFAHFLIATLNWKQNLLSTDKADDILADDSVPHEDSHNFTLCSFFLDILQFHSKSADSSSRLFIDRLLKFTGFDWLLMFIVSDSNETIAFTILSVLANVLSNNESFQKFQDNMYIGNWMHYIQIAEAAEVDVLNPNRKRVAFNTLYISNYVHFIESSCIWHPQLLSLIPMLGRCFGLKFTTTSSIQISTTNRHLDEARAKSASEFIPVLISFIAHSFFQGTFPAESIRILDELRSICMSNKILIEQFNNDIFITLLSILIHLDTSKESSANANNSLINIEGESSEVEVFWMSLLYFMRDILIGHIKLNMKRQLTTLAQLVIVYPIEMQVPQVHTCRITSKLYRSVLLQIISEIEVSNTKELENCQRCILILLEIIVNNLWRGFYVFDGCEIFLCIIKIMQRALDICCPIIFTDFYRILNRTILFILSSFKQDSQDDSHAIKEALYVIVDNKATVFSNENSDSQFIYCFAYCLFQICTTDGIPLSDDDSNNSNSIFHIDVDRQIEKSNARILDQSIVRITRRIWLYICDVKQPVIEDAIKSILNSKSDIDIVKSIDQAMHVLKQYCLNAWIAFIDLERQGQQESTTSKTRKITAFSHQISRVIGRRSSLIFNETKSPHRVENEELYTMQKNIRIAKDIWEGKLSYFRETEALNRLHQTEKWKVTEAELFRERAIWGPYRTHPLTRWLLDTTEGFSRMRKRLIRNDNFFNNYEQVRQDSLSSSRPKSMGDNPRRPSSWIVNLYKHCRHACVKEELCESLLGSVEKMSNCDFIFNYTYEQIPRKISETNISLLSEPETIEKLNSLFSDKTLLENEYADNADTQNNACEEAKSEEDANHTLTAASTDCFRLDQRLAHLIDTNEQVLQAYSCKRVCGLSSITGLFFIGQAHFYVVDGYTCQDGSLVSTETLNADLDATVNAELPPKMCEKFAYDNVTDVLKRRFLLQPVAIEIFSGNGRNILLAFNKSERDYVYSRLLSICNSQIDKGTESVSGQKRNVNIEHGSSTKSFIFNALFSSEKSVMQRWEKGEISNFEYIMYLNTIAGRSYNDLVQYPVFPWVIADYDSEVLDFQKQETFRDLTKPMGAQSAKRFEQFQIRASEIDHSCAPNESNEKKAYHYNTHYSSAMIVAWYLMRLEPFASILVNLQGGSFDLPDRAFHSIKECWLSASEKNMSDVKELIPEFFYLPEFLSNSNRFNFGIKQNGDVVDDVILPPWAKGDTIEFIRIHRMALESDYVSANLHHWIDLIFGYKQRGSAAYKAGNSFHPLFYEGTVDFDSISDSTVRASIIGFINNFGQIPKQIFKRHHVSKKIARSLLDSPSIPCNFYFFNVIEFLSRAVVSTEDYNFAINWLGFNDRNSLIALPFGRTFIPISNVVVDWTNLDGSLRVYTADTTDKLLYSTTRILTTTVLCCCCCYSSKILVFGCIDSLASVWSVGRIRYEWPTLKANLIGHESAVTVVSASDLYRMIYTGSFDRTVLIWDMNDLTLMRQLRNHPDPINSICIHSLTGDAVTSCGSQIFYWSINGDLLASADLRQLTNHPSASVNTLALSQIAEWDNENVIIIGDSLGFVSLFRLQMIQEPIDTTGSHDSQLAYSSSFTESVSPIANVTYSDNASSTGKNPSSAVLSQNSRQSSFDHDFVIVSEKEIEQSEQWARTQNASVLASNSDLIAKWQTNRLKNTFASLNEGNRWVRKLVLAGIFQLSPSINQTQIGGYTSVGSMLSSAKSTFNSNIASNDANAVASLSDVKHELSSLTHFKRTGATALVTARNCNSFYAADCNEKFESSMTNEHSQSIRFPFDSKLLFCCKIRI